MFDKATFSVFNQQKPVVESENSKCGRKFDDVHEKLEFLFLPEKCLL